MLVYSQRTRFGGDHFTRVNVTQTLNLHTCLHSCIIYFQAASQILARFLCMHMYWQVQSYLDGESLLHIFSIKWCEYNSNVPFFFLTPKRAGGWLSVFVICVFMLSLWLFSASWEQLWRRQGSATPGEEAGTQTDREMLVWGRSGKKSLLSVWNLSFYAVQSI